MFFYKEDGFGRGSSGVELTVCLNSGSESGRRRMRTLLQLVASLGLAFLTSLADGAPL